MKRAIMAAGIRVVDVGAFTKEYPEIAASTFLSRDISCLPSDMVLYVPAGVCLENTVSLGEMGLLTERLFVILDQGSAMHIIDEMRAATTPANKRSVTYWVRDHATLNMLYYQPHPTGISPDLSVDIWASSHGIVHVDALVLGGEHTRITIRLYAQGEYAQMRLRGAYLLGADQSVHMHVLQKHTVAHTTSDVVVRGILKDSAQALYGGLIFIDKDAPHTDAVQENKNIVLGATAVADSRPTLEVLNNEVRCMHGSAVGPLDPQHLFYAACRGLDESSATQMLLHGFVGDLFAQPVQSLLHDAITEKIAL
jgi:Fe-S cluster assembly protein SufD